MRDAKGKAEMYQKGQAMRRLLQDAAKTSYQIPDRVTCMKWLVTLEFLQSTAPAAYIHVPGKEFWVVTLSCQKQAIQVLFFSTRN